MTKRASLPKIHRHKTGQARVRIEGKDYYLGAYGSEEAETRYRELVGKHLLAAAESPPKRRESATISELLAGYFAHAIEYYRSPDGKPTSELAAMRDVLKIIRQELPDDFPCGEFGPLRLKAIRKSLVERGLTRSGVNRRIERIVRIFRWGSENEIIAPETYFALKSVQGLRRGRTTAPETDPIKSVPLADITAAVRKMSPTIRAMVELQLATAMRPGEIVIMRPADVDCSGETWHYRPQTHKTAWRGHERVIRIGPKGRGVLAPWLDGRDPHSFCFSPMEAREAHYKNIRTSRKTKVQPSQVDRRKKNPIHLPGDCYTTTSYARAVTRACTEAGVEPFSPNRLRHTAATIIRRDFGLEAAQVILGHKHAAVTQVYAERDAALAERVAAEIG